MAAVSAAKLANWLSLLEILALVIGGSLICVYAMNTSLLLLIALTLVWMSIIFLENLALNGASSYLFLTIIALIRIVVLTALCLVPIILASYYSKNIGIYMVLFGGFGVLFNPAKGLVLLKAARTSKELGNDGGPEASMTQ